MAKNNLMNFSEVDITKEEILTSIRDGVKSAMWQMITDTTDMPGADFFER
jgi:hypothetical protein